MATGIEALGLALALFQALVSTTQAYNGLVSSQESRHLAESLENQKTIFLNSVERLFREIVSADELGVLLEDPSGGSWRNPDLSRRVIDQLGGKAAGLLDTASGIYKALARLQEKLPLPQPNARADERFLARTKKVMKSFIQGPRHRTSLISLKSRISEFCTLIRDVVELAPARRRSSRRISHLNVIQDGATILYNTLHDGLECECEDPHPAHMRLEVWPTDEQQDPTCLKFSFLFASNAEEAREDHWRIAEVVPPPSSSNSPRSGAHNARATNRRTDPVPGVSPRQSSSQQSNLLVPPRVTFQVNNPRSPSGNQATPDPTGIGFSEDPEQMADLCRELMGRLGQTCPRSRTRLGSMSDSDGSEYGLFTVIDNANCKPPKRSTSLTDILSASGSQSGNADAVISRAMNLSMKIRVQLSLMLAWAVLQLSTTHWLEGHWTKENILLVMDGSNNPQPYVSHRFMSRRQSVSSSSATMVPTNGSPYTSWVKNDALFALSVFLLEMCYHKRIEDLAIEDEKQSGSLATFLTATRLANEVAQDMGVEYAKAVNSCLYGNSSGFDIKSFGQESGNLAPGVLRHIIEPLETVARSFGHGPPLVSVI